ncbi:MAG TPA: hypothetical protein VKT32_01795 [Chthonomonadaceae bacterium]|nr:hypothetical protein [Chthonomonadaceae bacterium]
MALYSGFVYGPVAFRPQGNGLEPQGSQFQLPPIRDRKTGAAGKAGYDEDMEAQRIMHKGFATPPGYIPYYYDGFVQTAIIAFWLIIGIIAIFQGRRNLLPKPWLKRRILIVGCCAFASLFLYAFYILQRQTVESAAAARENRQQRWEK